jgi:hypothetical protein
MNAMPIRIQMMSRGKANTESMKLLRYACEVVVLAERTVTMMLKIRLQSAMAE